MRDIIERLEDRDGELTEDKIPQKFFAKFESGSIMSGGWDIGPKSDRFAKMSKKQLAQEVSTVGFSREGTESPEYWMQYPAIILMIILADTVGGGK